MSHFFLVAESPPPNLYTVVLGTIPKAEALRGIAGPTAYAISHFRIMCAIS